MAGKESRSFKSPIIQITQDSVDQPNVTITTTYNQETNQSSTCKEGAMAQDIKRSSEDNTNTNNTNNVDCSSSSGGAHPSTSQKPTSQQSESMKTGSLEEQTHAYKKRFFILALFCAHSAINSFQWIQYSSITNIISEYYGATNIQVNLTSLVYMITYIPFIIQASLMLERVGLKKAIIMGTVGTAFGSLVKWWLGGQPGMAAFWWMMVGQTIVALSQLYIISIPPLLAAVWFPDNQVSTATGVGVFGNQLGIALGFIVPPWVVGSSEAGMGVIGQNLNNLSCAIFWISFVICLISILTLEDKPPKPPGSASLHAAHQHEAEVSIETYASIKGLCKDADFRYLILSYGINVGCFYAVSTVLNQMVAAKWPQLVDLAGTMGLFLVLSGMAGSVLCGQLLDRTHAYKLIIVLIYLFSLLSMLLFTVIIRAFTQVWPLYAVSIILGFFMTGYLPLGFEFAAEITYPHPANTPAGLLNLSAQVFGLILTYASSMMVDELSDLWANIFLTTCLGVGLGLTIAMKADLKRQKAVAEEQMKI